MIKDQKQKEKIKKILDELKNKRIIEGYCTDIWNNGYVITRNDYIMDKFKKIGIKAYPVRKCDIGCFCENNYLTEEDEKNQEICSNNCTIETETYIEIPEIEKEKIIDEIFNTLGDD